MAARSELVGDFSISDLLREAAARSIDVSHMKEVSPAVDTPTMSGMMKAETIRDGLLMSGYDLTHLADFEFAMKMERSVFCALLLDGESTPLRIEGHAVIDHKPQRVEIIGFGEPVVCRRRCEAGTHARTFGVTLRPEFLEQSGEHVDDDGLAPLRAFLKPGLHRSTLPWSPKIVEIGNQVLDHSYSGTLGRLYHESHSLRFLIEVAVALREQTKAQAAIGRIPYDRATQAREILDRNLIDPPRALDLARQVGVNLTTLQANFKAAFGTTIFGYVRKQRLDMGRILITENGLRIADAGLKVGFSNAAAFTAAYRKHFGRPPTGDVKRAT
jgi:AraC-like DNA-binding protein